MTDLNIMTNSEQTIEELASVQEQAIVTDAIIAETNANTKASFDMLNAAVVAANMNMMAMGESSATATPLLAQMMAQSDSLKASVAMLNSSVSSGIALENQFSGAVMNSSLSLFGNMMQVGLSNAMLTAFGTNMATTMLGVQAMSAMIDAETSSIKNCTDAVAANLAGQQAYTSYLAGSSSVLEANKEQTEEQTIAIKLQTNAVNALAAAETLLSVITAVNTTLSMINNAVTLKETLTKKKNAAASSSEGIAALAAAVPKALSTGAGMGLPGLVWLAAMLALFATGMATYAVMKSTFSTPAMATGGVVSKPTMALVGEGRYPEAVVPLGNSPQFASMKADIASAVLQGVAAMSGGKGNSGGNVEVVLNIDGDKFARAVMPAMEREYRRKGRSAAVIRSV